MCTKTHESTARMDNMANRLGKKCLSKVAKFHPQKMPDFDAENFPFGRPEGI